TLASDVAAVDEQAYTETRHRGQRQKTQIDQKIQPALPALGKSRQTKSDQTPKTLNIPCVQSNFPTEP
ncbi:hypothetical protein, partial [Roseibium sp.]|uniref:hypothetical protein n=1 Tax=Roseibium sp. TaxID=1936156 RepID=UPI003A969FC0